MPENVIIRNRHAGPSVFLDQSGNTNVPYEWAGYGDPNQEDYQEMPERVTKQPIFRKALSRGVFEIVNDDSDGRLYTSGQTWQDARSASFSASEQYMDRSNTREIYAHECVGPGTKPGTECGVGVVSGQSGIGASAPLCNAHKHLAGSYGIIVGEDGKEKWTRASISGRNQVD